MTGKFARDWFVSLIIAVVPDVLWHRILFGDFYGAHQSGVARVVDGKLAPIIPVIIVMDILFAFGFTYFLSAAPSTKVKMIMSGALFGLIVTGYFSLASYALLPHWDVGVALMDAGAGLVDGILQGLFFAYVAQRAASGQAA